jgi:signal transduction histidine kinase
MPANVERDRPTGLKRYATALLWVSGGWILLLVPIAVWLSPGVPVRWWVAIIFGTLAAPIPAVMFLRSERRRWKAAVDEAEEREKTLELQLETVRFRTGRLREELSAADKQARLSHQLTLLGQFTAGFMHEFNNPLAIVSGRLEVLREERKDDAALCADIDQMLTEARYMSRIARTLLQALRRERGNEAFEPSLPAKVLNEVVDAFKTAAESQGVEIIEQIAEAPRVDVPEHVMAEVVRGLLANSLRALEGHSEAGIWLRLEPYRCAGAKVVLRIEDNGPGVPESIREHLFEPFVTQSSGRERLGLGLFLAASLLDMYDGRIRYEARDGRGACFVLELPPTRFTRGQPYHWFIGGVEE